MEDFWWPGSLAEGLLGMAPLVTTMVVFVAHARLPWLVKNTSSGDGYLGSCPFVVAMFFLGFFVVLVMRRLASLVWACVAMMVRV
ncbi:hypothetical protein GOP47_0011648 [Adiantum capillus-veneris]|uniref:Transmembrane protein n=1 Tax=Adiantum capillus-veneris TaxID=13818 RepID=A0A9D4UT60_ADICA|nr:hypothetical protein GOP47_0011648 [Adiantum capillus-veneris]